jgi:hypothetical protein
MSSEEMTYQNIWNTLSSVDCNEHTDKKGGLTYLSWAWAWGILMEHYPMATFEFSDNEAHADGSMTVHCTVTIGECQRSMWLPVMDYKNAAIKSANSRDISDNKMRCLTKALALFGLGHYIFAGEDTVNAGSNAQTVKAQAEKPPPAKAKPKPPLPLEARMSKQKELVAGATPDNITNVMDFVFRTIFHFALPPEGTEQKEGAPETVAGWIDQFTSSNGNKKTLVELYNAGFKEEVQALNKRLDKIRSLEIEELYQLLREQKEKENG